MIRFLIWLPILLIACCTPSYAHEEPPSDAECGEPITVWAPDLASYTSQAIASCARAFPYLAPEFFSCVQRSIAEYQLRHGLRAKQ